MNSAGDAVRSSDAREITLFQVATSGGELRKHETPPNLSDLSGASSAVNDSLSRNPQPWWLRLYFNTMGPVAESGDSCDRSGHAQLPAVRHCRTAATDVLRDELNGRQYPLPLTPPVGRIICAAWPLSQ